MMKAFVRPLLLAILALLVVAPASAQLAYVTFVHNSPDPDLDTVDLYVTQTGQPQKITGVAYQQSNNLESAFIFGGILTTISVAPKNSVNEAQAVIRVTFTPDADKGYAVIVSGVQEPAEFEQNPSGRSIKLNLKQFEIPFFTGDFTESGVQVYHGATDVETANFTLRNGSKPLAQSLEYDTNTVDLVAVNRELGIIDVTRAGGNNSVIGSFQVDFASLSSEVVLFVLSGFKTPADNNSDANLVLLAVLDDGRVVRNELIAGSQVAKTQIIHNAADPELTIVDLYIGDDKVVDNLTYLKATPFNDVSAGEPLTIGIAPALSAGAADIFATVDVPALKPGRTYHMMLAGVKDTSKFAKNPDGLKTDLTVIVAEDAQTVSSGGGTAVRSMNGNTDGMALVVRNRRGTTWMDNLTYGGITGYQTVAAEQDTFWLYDTVEDTLIKGWVGNLSGDDRATCLMATGFMNPSQNQNGQAFKLVLVDVNGNVSDRLTEIQPISSVEEELLPASVWNISPNPASETVSLFIAAPWAAMSQIRADVMSADGRLVQSATMINSADGYRLQLDVSSLAQGTYYVRLTQNGSDVLGTSSFAVQR